LAGLLKWPQATFASKIELNDRNVDVTREVDSGLETLRLKLPVIITCDLRLNVPKIASLLNVKKAKNIGIE
jgi:electron transfer flavoprotein beta subunit